MSYDPKYENWVKKFLDPNRARKSGIQFEFHEVYRDIPILSRKYEDDPSKYRYKAPVTKGTVKNIKNLHDKLDQYIESVQSKSMTSYDKMGEPHKSDEKSNFWKWQNCQVELEEMKRREADVANRLKDLQEKIEN